MTVSGLYIYPVKALGGIALNETRIDERGFAGDRRYMLVDRSGKFVTQRECKSLSQFQVSLVHGGYRIESLIPGKSGQLEIPAAINEGAEITVSIWQSNCTAWLAGSEAHQYFSRLLEMDLRLVYMPRHSVRPSNPQYTHGHYLTSFTDGYPIMLHAEGALRELNERMTEPVGWERFRPSLLIEGGSTDEEDSWLDLQVGGVTLRCVKPCSRCVVTTIDQRSATPGAEPLRTLNTYRKYGHLVYFGQNAIVIDGTGKKIKLGDVVQVLSTQPPWAALSAKS